jgi:hypothetical protein
MPKYKNGKGCKHGMVYQILVNVVCALMYNHAWFLHGLCPSSAKNWV